MIEREIKSMVSEIELLQCKSILDKLVTPHSKIQINHYFDTSYYLGTCDREIEIEFDDYSEAERMIELLSLSKIETCEMGKYSRFVREYQRWNEGFC